MCWRGLGLGQGGVHKFLLTGWAGEEQKVPSALRELRVGTACRGGARLPVFLTVW